jgi:GTPase SAR1 family protein
MRIYVSSTSLDLAEYRRAVIRALQRSGHTPVCMEHHAPGDVVPKDESLREVATCDVYIGIFAWRYGFIPQGCEFSITEMEYREAQRLKTTKLIFLLRENVEWPAEYREGGENGQRIRELREKLKQDKWVGFFTNPDNLATEVLAATSRVAAEKLKAEFVGAQKATQNDIERQSTELQNLIEQQAQDERRRRRKERNRVPIPVPEKHILHFKDRDAELSKLRQCLADKNIRMVLICGRGGVGKTTLAAKLIQELTDESVVYVSLGVSENRSPDRILELLSLTLDQEAAMELKEIWKQGDTPLRERLAVLFHRSLSHHRCLIVLDNLESVLDDDNQIHQEFAALRQFIEAFLEYDHASLLVVTSRRAVNLSRDAAIAAISRTVQIPLDNGLPESFAIALLRELDRDGRLGIRSATDDVLGSIVRRCECIPRTLEALVATLLHRPTWTLDTLLQDETRLTEILDNPAREVYTGLSSDHERLVMQALSVYDKPVPTAAIHFILPGFPIEEILDKLVRNFVVNYDQALKRYWLHSLDRQYAYSQIPDHG